MLRKGVLTAAALAALGSALAFAHSQQEHRLQPSAVYATKVDFDRAFANFEGPSLINAESRDADRELLRLAGTKRFLPASPAQRLEVLKTKVVDSEISFDFNSTPQANNPDPTANLSFLLDPAMTAVRTQITKQVEDARIPSL
jgi:hypothetical protein